MKNKFFKTIFYTFGIMALIGGLFSFMPQLAAELPAWVNHLTIAASGMSMAGGLPTLMIKDGQIMPMSDSNVGQRSVANKAASMSRVPNQVAQSTDGVVKASIKVISASASAKNFTIGYTIGGTYVAATDVPIVPYVTTDALPTGCTITSGTFATQAAYAGWFGAGQKNALFGKIQVSVSDARLLNLSQVRDRSYNDKAQTINDDLLDTSLVYESWPNPNIATQQYAMDTQWMTGEKNRQITQQFPAVTGTINMTVYYTDTKQGATLEAAI